MAIDNGPGAGSGAEVVETLPQPTTPEAKINARVIARSEGSMNLQGRFRLLGCMRINPIGVTQLRIFSTCLSCRDPRQSLQENSSQPY